MTHFDPELSRLLAEARRRQAWVFVSTPRPTTRPRHPSPAGRLKRWIAAVASTVWSRTRLSHPGIS